MTDQHRPRCMLVTGGAGFIGCNFVRHVLAEDSSLRVINVDALTYAGHLASLSGISERCSGRYHFEHADICDAGAMQNVLESFEVDTVVHFAAESHVDRSIDGPLDFIETNVRGTAVLLERARALWSGRSDVRFHHVSTDEVYGSLGDEGFFHEDDPYDPSSPYAASKAASDHLVRAWHRTYGLPVTISNCSNNYGPYQFPEKLIPLMIANAINGEHLPVYGDGENVRDWLFVEDHCRAIVEVIRGGRPGRTYNIGGHNEMANIDVVHLLCDLLDEMRPDPDGPRRRLIRFVDDRPGHDRRYAIDAGRIERELGWRPRLSFAEGLRCTVEWYLENAEWRQQVCGQSYAGERLGLVSS